MLSTRSQPCSPLQSLQMYSTASFVPLSPQSQTSIMNSHQAVSSLPPSDSPIPSPPHVPTLLRQLFLPLRLKWVVEFLFAHNPIHQPHLACPSVSEKAILRTVSTSRVEPPQMRRRRPAGSDESSHLHGNFLYVPAVSIDSVTLGFGVMDAVFSIGDDQSQSVNSPAKAICTHFRFVRDENLRLLLEVYDLSAQDSVVMSYTSVESTTHSRIFKARFHKQQLLAILRQEHTSFYFDKVMLALQSFETELQHRDCPKCGANAEARCECPTKVPNNAHPFDHVQFRAGMAHGTGVFEGVANKVRFEEGEEIDYTMLGSRSSVQVCNDLEVVKRLISWAKGKDQQTTSGLPGDAQLRNSQGYMVTRIQDMSGERQAGGALLTLATQELDSCNAEVGRRGMSLRGGVLDLMDEKELKMEIRKQKNRESALRSNRKKKAFRDGLERNLKECQETVERLRKRETHLRQENFRLRRTFLEGG